MYSIRMYSKGRSCLIAEFYDIDASVRFLEAQALEMRRSGLKPILSSYSTILEATVDGDVIKYVIEETTYAA